MPAPTTDYRWRAGIARVHIETIAGRAGIKVQWKNGRAWLYEAAAYEAAWMVVVPRPHNPAQYLVALHELGHLLGPIKSSGRQDLNTNTTPGEYQFLCEASAWAWAVEHVHPDLEHRIDHKVFRSVIGDGMSTHAWSVALAAEGRID